MSVFYVEVVNIAKALLNSTAYKQYIVFFHKNINNNSAKII